MRLYIILISFFMAGIQLTEAQERGHFVLNGEVHGLKSGFVYLQKFNNKSFITLDSAKIVGGKYQFRTKLELPELYGLTLDKFNSPVYVFLEDKNITVSSDSAAFNKSTKLTGSESNALFVEYKKQKDVKIDSFIRANPASIVSAYVLYRDYSYLLNSEEIAASINLLSPRLYHTPYVTALKELAITKKQVEPGQKALDFTSKDQFGNTVKLSQQFGKYLLLTFWAGWCPDCRRENPALVATYQKYHDKGFDVFGVSLDKNKETWLNGIKNDNLTWKHVSDLAYWDSSAAKLYGVRWIPSNFLIGPDGVIIAQNLQGAALEAKLDELLGVSGK